MEKINPIVLRIRNEEGNIKTEYTLEFNRASILYAEQRGFNIQGLGAKPMTAIPELFFYAFRMHHPKVTKEQSDDILFNKMGGLSEEVLQRLGELYNAPFTTLVPDEEEGGTKNAQVETLL